MGNAVLPDLIGLKWDIKMSPQFSTRIQRSVNGTELRTALMAYPLWIVSLAYEVLRDDIANNELKQLAGFFMSRLGSFDSFLYSNPDDHTVTIEQFGIGDGATVGFQLTRGYGGFAEPVMNLNGAPSIYVDGVLKTLTTHYTISATGYVTFVTAPASGKAMTWTGNYYWRVRFTHDSAEFSQFMKNLWELKKLEFVGAVGNKV